MSRHHKPLIEMIRRAVGEPRAGAEIGVYRGLLSEALLRAFPGCEMLFVDPWREWPAGTSYRDTHRRTGSLTAEEWAEVEREARGRIWGVRPDRLVRPDPPEGSVAVVKMTSADAVWSLNEEYRFDFVFLDADHSYAAVAQDVRLWLPRVRPGGLLCGHDYGGAYRGVQQAVDELLGRKYLILPGRRTRLWGYVKQEDGQ